MEIEINGVKVSIAFSFCVVLLLVVELTGSDWALWCACCCVMHELGHLAAYAWCGAPPREIRLEAGGMRIVPSGAMLGFWQEILVLWGGALVNLATAGILIACGMLPAAGIPLFLAGFNLLPLAPLDGGQFITLLLEQRLPPSSAWMIAKTVHWLVWCILVTAGCMLIWRTGNFTLLLTMVCLSWDKNLEKRL